MEIIRDINKDKNFHTELYNYLINIPDDMLFNNEHKLRKPLGIFNVSAESVLTAFDDVLEKLLASNSDKSKLGTAYKELLSSMDAFIDDSYHIIKCFYPANSVNKDIKFANIWLENADSNTIRSYYDAIDNYRKLLANIVNKIKHNHARIEFIEMSTNIGKVYGYCIVGADDKGAIVPDEEIHKRYKGMYTAFSINYDIRYHFINFYIVSRAILKTINKVVNAKHGKFLVDAPTEALINDKIIKILNSMNKLSYLFFDDEYFKDIPQIEFNGTVLKLRYPASSIFTKKLPKYKSDVVKYVFSGDGASVSWGLPYLNDLSKPNK